jgi:hypothetical protein
MRSMAIGWGRGMDCPFILGDGVGGFLRWDRLGLKF